MNLELPQPFLIRPAVSEDADALFEIHKTAMFEYVDQIWGWDDDWQDQDFHKDFDPPIGRQVICDSNKPIGFLCLDSLDDAIYIGAIELHPSYQGRGIGSAIFKRLVEMSERDDRTLRLQVFKINSRARGLYERLGFAVMGQTEHHYQMERRAT